MARGNAAQAHAKLLGRIAAHFAESARLKQQSAEVLGAPIAAAGVMLAESLRSGGKALACGNGGSAAHAPHLAAQPINRLEAQRPPPPPPALTTPTPTPTPIANHHADPPGLAQQPPAPRGRRAP